MKVSATIPSVAKSKFWLDLKYMYKHIFDEF